MKKSKIVAISLLALSLSACHRKKDSKYQDWNSYQSSTPNYYVNDGNGYQHGGVSPIWIYWAYHMGQNGSIQSSPGYVYRTYGTNGHGGTYKSTSFGSRTSIPRGGISRGGFGSSGSHVSA